MSPRKISFQVPIISNNAPQDLVKRELSFNTCNDASADLDCSTKTGIQIMQLFLPEESWAKGDWERVSRKLTQEELCELDADYIVRVIRSSGFIAIPEKRKKRNLQLLKERVKWQKKYAVKEILSICDGTFGSAKGLKHPISPSRVEQFRRLAFPMKIYGVNKERNPVVKFCLKEAKWKEASKLFKDSTELNFLFALSLESLLRKLQKLGARSPCNCDNVVITGKYFLICDFEGLSVGDLPYGYKLLMHRIIPFIWKHYPDTVRKAYVINSRYCRKGSQILGPFISKNIIERIKFFADETSLVERLTIQDGFELSAIPVEFGGICEGKYVVDVSTD